MSQPQLTMVRFVEQDGEMEYYWSYYYPTEWFNKTDEFTILKTFFNPYLEQNNDDLGLGQYWNNERAVSIDSSHELPLDIDINLLSSLWIYGETSEPRGEE